MRYAFYSKVQLEIEGQTIDPHRIALFNATVARSLYDKNLFSFNFLHHDVSFWQGIIGKSTQLWGKVRWGVGGQDWSEYHAFKFLGIGTAKEGTFMRVTIVGASSMIQLKNQSHRLFFKDKTISEMVEQIVQENDLESDVDDTEGEYTMHQCMESDYDFILGTLIPRVRYGNDGRVLFYSGVDGKIFFKKVPTEQEFTFKENAATEGKDIGFTSSEALMMADQSNYGYYTQALDRFKALGPPYLYGRFASDATSDYEPIDGVKPLISGKLYVPAIMHNVLVNKLSDDLAKTVEERSGFSPPTSLLRVVITGTVASEIDIGVLGRLEQKMPDGQELVTTGSFLVYGTMLVWSGTKSTMKVFMERRGL